MTTPEIIECTIIDEALKKHYPQGVMHLARGKALEMEQRGLISIRVPSESERAKTAKRSIAAHQADSEKTDNYLLKDRFASRARGLERVAYIQDNSKLGGAEISNIRVVDVGQQCGYDIVGVTPARCNLNIIEECDVAIVNNFFEFQPDQLRAILRMLIERGIPYVKYDHDYREMRRTTLAQVIFGHASMAAFISPRHAKIIQGHLHSERLRDISVTLPLAINPDEYRDTGVHRRPGSVLVPTWRKGKENMARYILENPKNEYTFIGQCDRSFSGVSVSSVPARGPEKMAALYNEYESVLHQPDTEWAGERVYFEALLCGCKFIGNEHVGHLSWADNSRELLAAAPYKFWREVETRCL